jgi:hypothetical protein
MQPAEEFSTLVHDEIQPHQSNSCPMTILRLGPFPRKSSGYLFGYAHLTNTRSLALLGDQDANAYELLFSFSSPEEKEQFLDLVRYNDNMGNDYIENDFMSPTTEEIMKARPLAMVLPEDVVTHATAIAATICASTEDDRAAS